jgi:hypothetical protein
VKILPALRRLATGQKETLSALLLTMLIVACVPYLSLPRLAKEDATVIVRCSDTEKSTQMIVILLDHTKGLTDGEVEEKKSLQKIAEIEVDSDCHFTVRAPKTPIELHQP